MGWLLAVSWPWLIVALLAAAVIVVLGATLFAASVLTETWEPHQ